VIELEPPSDARVASYLRFIQALRDNAYAVWDSNTPREGESPAAFVARILRYAHDPDDGLVPATTYWAILDGEVVGRIALRHHLNASLEEFGGHVGYEVHPAFRRRGVATAMLRALIVHAKRRGMDRLLVTTAPDNGGSIGAITAAGGVLERTAFVQRVQRTTCYYWIALA
jgi:predicted acetyltransferase